MVAEQQILIVTTDPASVPSDEFLLETAFKLLDAKPPQGWRAFLDGTLKGLAGQAPVGVTFNWFQLATSGQSLSKNPEERGIAVLYSRPVVLELLRAIYAHDLKSMLPEALIIAPSDPKLLEFTCTDGTFITQTTYIRHPTDSNFFIRLADFHSYLIQEKRAEFFRLATALGAKEVRLVDSKENIKSVNAHISLNEPTDSVDVGVDTNTNRQIKSSFDLSASFTHASNQPAMPSNLRWFGSEPLWQAMAEARISHWVEKFRVSFTYSQDFNVNVALVAKVHDLGLSAGGSFSEIQRVEQEYIVEFFPRSDYGF